MAEKDLWAVLRDRMKIHGHFDRIENMVGCGMPDVTYCVQRVEGFIELKQVKEWPARPDTAVAIPHYSPGQRLWARQRISAGGRVYLLLHVVRTDNVYLLFDSAWSRLHLGIDATQADCIAKALVVGFRKFPTAEVLAELTSKKNL